MKALQRREFIHHGSTLGLILRLGALHRIGLGFRVQGLGFKPTRSGYNSAAATLRGGLH